MAIRAFLDAGFSDSQEFCSHLLGSSDFLIGTLKKHAEFGSEKAVMAENIAERLSYGDTDPKELLLDFCKQNRQWFTFKYGEPDIYPKLKDAEILLNKIGGPGWYGPILSDEEDAYYYIRTKILSYYTESHSHSGNKVVKNRIRWPIIAKVNDTFTSLFWNGFSTNQIDNIHSHSQFPFWLHIPGSLEELEGHLGGAYSDLIAHELVLKTIWEKFIDDSDFTWKHLAVRAEASGVNLSARSKGISEIRVEGLLALANKLASSVIDSFPDKYARKNFRTYLKIAENSIIRTLIHEWGTKSYEFSLDEGRNKLFRAHCYFGLKPTSETQDCFPHFKCFRAYGGSEKALNFLINEDIEEF